MDKFGYLKILQTAESDFEHDKLEKQFRHCLDELKQCDNDIEEELDFTLSEVRVMCELRVYYVCPLARVCQVIERRMSEEDAIGSSDWRSLPKMPPLTLEEMFQKLTVEISPDASRRIIGALDCTSVAKSDLMESVKANDFTKFDNVVRTNAIDCGLAMNVCSNICFDSDFGKAFLNNVADYGDEMARSSDGSEFLQRLSMGYALNIEEIVDYCKCKLLPDDEISGVKGSLLWIEEKVLQLFKENKKATAAYLEIVITIISMLYRLQDYFNSGNLNAIEISFLKDFQRRKRESTPCVGMLLDMLFTGRFLEEDGLQVSKMVGENPEVLIAEYVKNVSQVKTKALTDSKATTEKVEKRKIVSPDEVRLPDEINTERNRMMFAKAINAGLVDDNQDGHFEWKMSKASLSYFCGRLFCGDCPSEDKVDEMMRIVWKKGKGRLPGKVLEGLFCNGEFAGYRNKRTTDSVGVPKEHERVDELFKQLLP